MSFKFIKISFFLLGLFLQFGLFSQSDFNKVNFGELNYQIHGRAIQQSNLEQMLKTYSSIADKKVALEELFLPMLIFEKDPYQDSLIHHYQTDYTKQDSLILDKLPNISDNFRSKAWNLIWMCYFGRAYLDDISFVEAYLKISKAKKQFFPHLNELDDFQNKSTGLLWGYYVTSKWAVKYPNEVKYFEQLLIQQTLDKLGDDNEESVIVFCDSIRQSVKKSRSVYNEFLPPSSYVEALKKFNTSTELNFNGETINNEEELTAFLNKAYVQIYDKSANEAEMNSLIQYLEQNKIYDIGFLYLALILNKYE